MKYICGSGFPAYPIFKPTLNNYLLLKVKYLNIGTFSDFEAIFFVECFNKIK